MSEIPRRVIESRFIAGEPIRIGRDQIITLTRSIRLRPFGSRGGLVWNRPSAAVVVEEDGTERVVPIRDVTRRLQILFLGAGLIGSLLLWGFHKGFNSR